MIDNVDNQVIKKSYNWQIDLSPSATRLTRGDDGLLRFDYVDQTQSGHNVITTAGIQEIVNLMTGSGSAFTHFAIGSGSTSASSGQTALVTETTRALFTNEIISTDRITWQYLLPATASNGVTLSEAGVFNDASAGTMLNRYTYTSFTKNSGIQALYTVVLTIS